MPRRKSANTDTMSTKASTPVATLPIQRFDSWTNVIAGLGGKADKSRYTQHSGYEILDDQTILDIYMSEGLGKRIVDVVADDMTREWIDLETEDEKTKEKIFEVTEQLDAEEKFNEAIRWQRAFGGAIMVIGAMDGRRLDEPLNENKIRKIEYLRVFDRTQISISESIFDTNPMSPTFGQVLIYKINNYVNNQYIPLMVHYTRVIPFKNDPIPAQLKQNIDSNYKYFGMSTLQPIYEDIRDLGAVNQSSVNILMEFCYGVFKIAHLAEIMSQPGGESAMVSRLEIMNMSKSVANALIIDAEGEEFTKQYASLAGLPEMIDRFMLKLSGSTGIPVTRLFGRSPAGLNATGENDLRNYYDLVEANQRNKLKPPIQKLVTLICSMLGIKQVPKIVFNSLYQMTELEYAELEAKQATMEQTKVNTMMTLVNMGALDPDEVRHEYLGKTGTVQIEEPDMEGFDYGSDPRKQPKEKDEETDKGKK